MKHATNLIASERGGIDRDEAGPMKAGRKKASAGKAGPEKADGAYA